MASPASPESIGFLILGGFIFLLCAALAKFARWLDCYSDEDTDFIIHLLWMVGATLWLAIGYLCTK